MLPHTWQSLVSHRSRKKACACVACRSGQRLSNLIDLTIKCCGIRREIFSPLLFLICVLCTKPAPAATGRCCAPVCLGPFRNEHTPGPLLFNFWDVGEPDLKHLLQAEQSGTRFTAFLYGHYGRAAKVDCLRPLRSSKLATSSVRLSALPLILPATASVTSDCLHIVSALD